LLDPLLGVFGAIAICLFYASTEELYTVGSRAPSFTADSGLGLYVVRKIVVAHGGTLEFDPERMGNAGVAFRLSLPRANSQPDES
jgi:K+-sensing histidine kinase KdpD